MTQRLSELRAQASLDGGQAFERTAQDMARALQQFRDAAAAAGTASVGAEEKIGRQRASIEALKRAYVDNYAAQQQLERGLRQLDNAIARDAQQARYAAEIMDGLQAKLGLVVTRADLAAKGHAALAGALQQAGYQWKQVGTGLEAAGRQAEVATRQTRQLQFAYANLASQVNDVASGLLSGQSPFMILAQQGGQVYQIFRGQPGMFAEVAASLRNIRPGAVGAALGLAELAISLKNAIDLQQAYARAAQAAQAAGRPAFSKAEVGSAIDAAARQPGITRSGAASAFQILERSPEIPASLELITKLVSQSANLAAFLGTDLPGAARKMVDAFADPLGALKEFDKSSRVAALGATEMIQALVDQGRKAEAAALLFDMMQGRLAGLHERGLTPAGRVLDGLAKSWDAFSQAVGSSVLAGGVLFTVMSVLQAIRIALEGIDAVGGGVMNVVRFMMAGPGGAWADKGDIPPNVSDSAKRGAIGITPNAPPRPTTLPDNELKAIADRYLTIDEQARRLRADIEALTAAITAGAGAFGLYGQALDKAEAEMEALEKPFQAAGRALGYAKELAKYGPAQRALVAARQRAEDEFRGQPEPQRVVGVQDRVDAERINQGIAAADTLNNVRAETAGRLAVAEAIAKGADATRAAQAAAQAHSAVVAGLAVNEQLYADELLRAAEAQAGLDLATRSRDMREQTTLLEVELQLRQQMPGQVEQILAPLRTQLELQRQYGSLLPEAQAQIVEQARKQGLLNDQIEQTRRQNELMLEPLRGALQSLQQSFADFFADLLQGGISTFRDLAGRVKAIFIRLAAELAALLTIRPVLQAVLPTFLGASVASSLGFGGSSIAGATLQPTGNGSFTVIPPVGGGGGLGDWLNTVNMPGGQPLFTGMPAGQFGPPQQGLLPFSGGAALSGLGAAASIVGAIARPNVFSIAGAGASVVNALGAFGAIKPVPYIGPIAMALSLIGTLFGKGKTSVGPNAAGTSSYAGNGFSFQPGNPAADNGGDVQVPTDVLRGFNAAFTGARSLIGARVGGALPALQTGYFKGEFFANVAADTEGRNFKEATDAIAFGVRRMLLKGFEAGTLTLANDPVVASDLADALRTITEGSLEDLTRDLTYVRDFRGQLALKNAGADPAAAQLVSLQMQAAEAARQQLDAMRQFVAEAERLFGADSAQAGLARDAGRADLLARLGVADDNGTFKAIDPESLTEEMTGLALALYQGEQKIRAYRDGLVELNYTTEQADQIIAAGIAHMKAAAQTAFFGGLDDQLYALQNPAGAAYAAIAGQFEQAMKDLGALDGLDAATRQARADQIALIAQLQIASQLQEERVSALQDEAAAAAAAQQASQNLYETLNRYRQGLLVNRELSPLSPLGRYDEARRQFEDVYSRSQGTGDDAIKAAAELPEIATAFLEASRDYNASNASYAQDFQRVQDVTLRVEQQHKTIAEQQLEKLNAINDNIKALQPAGVANDNRNWGDPKNYNLNRGLAGLTGYKGDFGQGGFQTYIVGQSDQIKEAARQLVRAYGQVPGFEHGGWHAGGLALVGERGPELADFRHAARIYPAEQTRALLGGAGNGADYRVLVEEIKGLRRDLDRLARHQAAVTADGAYLVRDAVETGNAHAAALADTARREAARPQRVLNAA